MKCDECILWKDGVTAKGYGAYYNGRLAHTELYERKHGKIPKGWEIHHTCRNKLCINLSHLKALPRPKHEKEHLKTHCVHGHDMSIHGRIYKDRSNSNGVRRICEECRKANKLRYQQSRAEGNSKTWNELIHPTLQ